MNKTTSKRVIQKTARATDDLIGYKIAHKITGPKSQSNSQKKVIYQKKDISHQKKDSKLLTS